MVVMPCSVLPPLNLFIINLFLLCAFGAIFSSASPENSSVCALNITYEPVGECVNPEEGRVIIWSNVPATRCCRNVLNSLSRALAAQSVVNSDIFLSQQQWQSCISQFQPQGTLSVSSCGFDALYRGNDKCSTLTLSSFKHSYAQQYRTALDSCARFSESSFDGQCTNCTNAMSSLIGHVTADLQAKGTMGEEMCGIAAVVAVVSNGIGNDAWIDGLYRCLPAMDSSDAHHDYFSIERSTAKAILVALIAITGMVLLIILIKFVIRKKPDEPKKVDQQGKTSSTWSGLYRFSRAEIEKAINYGNNKVSLGSGSAGRVYQGVLPSGQLIAVKHIYKTAMSDSFTREVERLSEIRHPNLVCLLGYCDEKGDQYLVYEYCGNGNLAHNLLRSDAVLPWERRVRILRDCALAVRFLHTHPDGCIIHRDIKLTNILLNENMEPKLSDFGLAKLIGIEESKVFTDVKGTLGYMDPEYMTNAKLTCASDIYSFGIVALQLLSGKKVIELDIEARETLTMKARDVANGKRPLKDFVDPRLHGNVDLKDFESILRVAVLCVASSSKGRPITKQVYDEMNRAWENTLARVPVAIRREANLSSSQSFSMEVMEI